MQQHESAAAAAAAARLPLRHETSAHLPVLLADIYYPGGEYRALDPAGGDCKYPSRGFVPEAYLDSDLSESIRIVRTATREHVTANRSH